MAKRKQRVRRRNQVMAERPEPPEPVIDAPSTFEETQIIASSLSLHDLFAQQARAMIDSADLDEEQKQTILVAMSCPCCGAGGMSFTAKLRR